MRPKKGRPDARGILLRERPFTYSARKDGTVAIRWKGRPAAVLAGKLAENFLAAAAEAGEDDLQLLMSKASGTFKRGNERKRA